MSDADLIVLAGIGLYVGGGIAAKLLWPSARVLLGREDDGPAIFKDGGPIEGGAVQFEQLPDVADSPAWTAKPDLPPFQEALNVVLDVGEGLRRCSACQSPATQFGFGDWSINNGEVYAEILETCPDCDGERTFYVNSALFVAFNAMAAWEQTRSALALGLSMEGVDTLDSDLRDLDGPTK